MSDCKTLCSVAAKVILITANEHRSGLNDFIFLLHLSHVRKSLVNCRCGLPEIHTAKAVIRQISQVILDLKGF